MNNGRSGTDGIYSLESQQLAAEVQTIVNDLRVLVGDRYLDIARKFMVIESTVERFLRMSAEERLSNYNSMITESATTNSLREKQKGFLVLSLLEDTELEKILAALADLKSKALGFRDHAHQKNLIQDFLTRYYELSTHHYFFLRDSSSITWDDLVGTQYNILSSSARLDGNLQISLPTEVQNRFTLQYYGYFELNRVRDVLLDAEAKLRKATFEYATSGKTPSIHEEG